MIQVKITLKGYITKEKLVSFINLTNSLKTKIIKLGDITVIEERSL